MEEQYKTILRLINKSKFGFSITQLTEMSKLSRSRVRTHLAYLEGSNKITFRVIGMAKVYMGVRR